MKRSLIGGRYTFGWMVGVLSTYVATQLGGFWLDYLLAIVPFGGGLLFLRWLDNRRMRTDQVVGYQVTDADGTVWTYDPESVTIIRDST
jgi:hypothetical protein